VLDRLDSWTNAPWEWQDLGLSVGGGVFLWKIWLRTPEMLAVPFRDFAYEADAEILRSMPAYRAADKILLIDTEGRSSEYFLDDPRVHFWDSTILDHDRFHSFWFWLDWSRDVEHHQGLADRMKRLRDKAAHTQAIFDLLLGREKFERTQIYDLVRSDPVLDPITISSYTGTGTQWIPGIDVDTTQQIMDYKAPMFRNAGTKANSMEGYQIPFHGKMTANLSMFVPWQIYDASWYTMLIETHHNAVFFSEKTTKPLLARRIFVALHHFPGALRQLRDLGFQTFGSVIDESYDDILDFDLRLRAALDQCRWLATQDPLDIYDRLWPVLEHNRRHALEFPGWSEVYRQMKEIIQ